MAAIIKHLKGKDMDSNHSISLAIRVRLLRIGKTQEEVATEAGINPTQFGKYLNCQVGWKVDVLERIAEPLEWASVADITNAAQTERDEHMKLAA